MEGISTIAELVYPMIMEVYLNGRLMTTRTSIRFIADVEIEKEDNA